MLVNSLPISPQKLAPIGENADSVRPNIEIDVRREAGRGCCDYLAMEFPNCHCCLENCPCAGIWQCGYLEACESGACKCGGAD